MTIDPILLEMVRRRDVVCPSCHSEFRPVEDGMGVECEGCGRVYPVRDGILVLLVDEATPPNSENTGF